MSQPSTQRIESLDSVRGLASLVVVICHGSGAVLWPQALITFFSLPLATLLIDGKAAVSMFFVLSGFVLSRPYIKNPSAPGPWGVKVLQFYVKRIARIYFPFFVVLVISAIIQMWFYPRYNTVPEQSDWFRILWSEPTTLKSFLKQCIFTEHQASHELLLQYWSLGVELKASALLPFLLLALRGGPFPLLAIGCGFLAFVGTGHYYFSFVLGILLAAYEGQIALALKNRGRGVKWLLLILAVILYHGQLIYGTLYPNSLAHSHPPWVLSSFGCVIFLALTFNSAGLQKVLNHPTLVFLGRISYGIYLVHFMMLLWVVTWLIHVLNGWGLKDAYPLTTIAILTGVALAVGVASVFYKLVELPSIRIGRSLSAAVGEKLAPAAARQKAAEAAATVEAGRR